MENRALTADEEKYYVVGGTATTSINDSVVSSTVEDVNNDEAIKNILDVIVKQQDRNSSVAMIGA